MAQVPATGLEHGTLTASAGSLARDVAWCARERNMPCAAIAPVTAPSARLDAITRQGARFIQVPFDRWWQTF